MAQQLAANESTPLSTPNQLLPSMEQPVEGGDPDPSSISLGSNTVNQPSITDFAFSPASSSHLSPMTGVLLSAPQHSTTEQQHAGLEFNPYEAALSLPYIEYGSTQRVILSIIHSGAEQEHESSHSSSGELSVGENTISNTFEQQAKIQQNRPFLLSDPMTSSIMLRRASHAESASALRSSTSQDGMPNVDPKRVKKLISTLGFDEQRSELLLKLVIATAPFHNAESLFTPAAPEGSNPDADALHKAIDNLMFAPKPGSPIGSPTSEVSEEGSLAVNSTENPTENIHFDANAAEDLRSRPVETRPDSPPLLWSTAAAEESLDPDAEDPTYFTVAEFINTIIEKGIQVESVTDEDWWVEEVRVAILNRLKYDASEEDPMAEEDISKSVVPEEEASEQVTAEEGSSELVAPTAEAAEQVKAKEDTSESDMQRWKNQGPDGWLKRDDGTEMNEEEVDEECARWDAMVRKARNEKEEEKAVPLLGKNIDLKDKGFWAFVRSSKQKEQTQDSISIHDQDVKASVSTHDQDEKAVEPKKKKGSNKNKNKNRKAKKNALKRGVQEDVSEEAGDVETIFDFMDLPREARKNVLGFLLVVDQELVPYHYVKGKVVQNVGLRKKPELNIMLALCSSQDKEVKRSLDDAKNILFRDNIFSIRKPNELIMFLGTIGSDSRARMKMGKNLLLTDTFFDKKRRYAFEMKWLAHWGKDLLFEMKGYNIIRSEIVATSPGDDLTCEPTDVDKALQSMVEVMMNEGERFGMFDENLNASGSSPMRLQSLDLGDKFDSLAEQIKTMGLAVGDGEVTKVTSSDTTKLPETEAPEKATESMSEKWKRKAREAGKKVKDEDAYGKFFLEALKNWDDVDEEDLISQDSGFYTPSVYSEHGKYIGSTARYSANMIRRGWKTCNSGEQVGIDFQLRFGIEA